MDSLTSAEQIVDSTSAPDLLTLQQLQMVLDQGEEAGPVQSSQNLVDSAGLSIT